MYELLEYRDGVPTSWSTSFSINAHGLTRRRRSAANAGSTGLFGAADGFADGSVEVEVASAAAGTVRRSE